MTTIAQVFQSRGLWRWFDSTVTNAYDGISEKGEDYSTTFGTPVAVPVGGQVKRIVHNNNSIGDVVEIMDAGGAVWLYQHITATVRVGQNLLCGDVVGTENGLPRDQYSTGPHIEVRYCPPGKWRPNIDSWVEPWVNPQLIFSTIGQQQAGTTGPAVPVPPGQQIPLSNGGETTSPTGPSFQLPTLHLKPDASVMAFFQTLDLALVVANPFDVNAPQDNLLGVQFTDPMGWIEGFGSNLVADLRGIFLRLVLMAIGVFIIWRVTRDFIDFGAMLSNAQALPGMASDAASKLLQ